MFNYQENLVKAGLTETQAGVYEVLLKFGSQPARLIQARSPYKRGLVYKSLEQLIEFNLVEKQEEKGKVALFLPKHPIKIKELAESRHHEAEVSVLAVDNIINQLSSDFNLATSQPGVRFFEGLDGLGKVYSDILRTGQDILLFRSVYDHNNEELARLVKKQIKKQVERNIHTDVLVPGRSKGAEDLNDKIIEEDKVNLIKRKIITRDSFTLDAQIIVFGNKTAITSLKEKIITTLVESKEISDTFRTIFKLIWLKVS